MVNIAKRMRGLKPKVRQDLNDAKSILTSSQLLTIRNGPGAAILPPSPAPQLIHVHLKAPPVTHKSPVHSARTFWRNHLRRLKFYNPALPITVDYTKAMPTELVTLTLQFEHKDPEILRKMPGSLRESARKSIPKQIVRDEMTEDEKEILARQQDPNYRNAPISWKSKEEETASLHQSAIDAEVSADKIQDAEVADVDTEASVDKIPEEETTNIDAGASTDNIQEEKTPGINASTLFNDEVIPSPTSTTAKGTPMLYTRAVTLGLSHRSAEEIWDWFSQRTRCTDVEKSDADSKEQAELDLFFEQSAIDRQRVKEGREAVRKEKADLQRARGEADRLKQEAL